MLKKQNIKLLINAIGVLVIFTILYNFNKLYVLNGFEKKNFVFEAELKVGEDDTFQLFYRDSTFRFSEKNSERLNITGSKDFQKLEFSIPKHIELYQLRFDIGNNYSKTPVEVRSFVLNYNGFFKKITADSISKYFRINNFIEEQTDNIFGRKVINNKSDPILISTNLEKLIKDLKKKTNYRRPILNIVLSLLLSFVFVIAHKQNKKKGHSKFSLDKGFTAVFFLILVLPFLDDIFSLDGYNIKEKRKLAQKPNFSYELINSYPSGFENYFNDHFGFRNAMISAGGTLKAKVFKTSPREEKVILGNEGWLFYWEGASKNSFYNKNPFEHDDLGKFGSMLKEANHMAKDMGASFIVSVYPNKHNVYLEKMPTRFKKGLNKQMSRQNQTKLFLDQLKIPYVAHERIVTSKKDMNLPLYQKNDSHWNALGAFIAYQELVSNFNESQVGPPLSLEDFDLTVENNYNGDLLNIMGVDNKHKFFKDEKINLIPKKHALLFFNTEIDNKKSRISHNLHSNNTLTLLIFGDSFTFELLNFIPFHFKKVVFVRGFKIDSDLIRYYNPNIVLYGIVNRNLENFSN